MNNVLLVCTECGYEYKGSSGALMNKIIMWNHIKKEHGAIAERVMGVPYGYQGPCMIQSFDAVRARPMGLR